MFLKAFVLIKLCFAVENRVELGFVQGENLVFRRRISLLFFKVYSVMCGFVCEENQLQR